jgi:hypothetical protein
MRTIARARALVLLALVPAVSACGGEATSAVRAQSAFSVAAPHVRCRTLDFAKDSSANQLLGIDNRGEIAGSGMPAGSYVIRPPYGQADYRLENYPGAVNTSVASVNDAGTIVGYYRDAGGDTAGFINLHGTWTSVKSRSEDLKLLGINDATSMVGFFTDRRGIDRAFEAGPSRRFEPPGGISDVAAGINDRGHVVGFMTVAVGVESFLFEGGAYTEFFYPGSTNTTARGINGQDEIVGSYVDSAGKTHGFLLTSPRANPRWQSFDEPKADGLTLLSGINDSGELVGSYRDASGILHGFLCR